MFVCVTHWVCVCVLRRVFGTSMVEEYEEIADSQYPSERLEYLDEDYGKMICYVLKWELFKHMFCTFFIIIQHQLQMNHFYSKTDKYTFYDLRMFNCLVWQNKLKCCKLDNRGPREERKMTFLLFSLITKYLRCKKGQLLIMVNSSLKFLYRLLNSGSVLSFFFCKILFKKKKKKTQNSHKQLNHIQ